MRTALANTLVLVAVAVTLSLVVGIAVGTLGAARRRSLIDIAATTTSYFGLSIPVFWLGLMLQLFFGLYLANWPGVAPPLLPTAGIYSPGQEGFDLIDRARVPVPRHGSVFLDALNSGDYAVLLPAVMIVAVAVFAMNLAADLLYGVLDPRIRRDAH